MIRLSLVFSLFFLLGCSTEMVKPEVTNTSVIRVTDSQCAPTVSAQMQLEQLGEKLLASALMKVSPTDTVIVTVFRGQTGDWTIMINSPNGLSCMVMWGEYWQMAGQES